MKLLGLDLETTSLDVKTAHIIEVGLVKYDSKLRTILNARSELVASPYYTQEASGITGIPLEAFESNCISLNSALSLIWQEAISCDYIVTHNGLAFDMPILYRLYEELGFNKLMTPVIDTLIDIDYPDKIHTRSLVPLAAYHGFLNPFPHRALFDVMTMLQILEMHDIEKAAELAKFPLAWIQAVVSFENKDAAKSLGYRWDAVNRVWAKSMRLGRMSDEATKVANKFELRILPEGYVFGENIL